VSQVEFSEDSSHAKGAPGDPAKLSEMSAPAPSMRALQAALGARVAAGAPSALARIEAPDKNPPWEGAAGRLSRSDERAVRVDDAFRVASTTKRWGAFDHLAETTPRLSNHSGGACQASSGSTLPLS
jgi:hypothetical protein